MIGLTRVQQRETLFYSFSGEGYNMTVSDRVLCHVTQSSVGGECRMWLSGVVEERTSCDLLVLKQ